MLINKLKQFWNFILESKYITLLTHIEPDGDTLGSAVALKELILLNSTNIKEVEISGADYPRNLMFLLNKTPSLVSDEFFNKSLKIVVDTSTKSRIYDQRVVTQEAIKIDHHPQENDWLFEIGGDNWPATGQLIALLIKHLNLKTNHLVLEAVAVAILTDTEFFKERNINSKTFEAMSELLKRGLDYPKLLQKMQLNEQENQLIFDICTNKQVNKNVSWVISNQIVTNDLARPLVAKFVEITTTEIALAFLKRMQGDYRVEIRSKGNFDVSKIAFYFGGGGHHNSAGFIVNNQDEINNVITYIDNLKN
ncbi:DHH family phosphoesterase [Mycoplasma miroungirhinis]|uniref:Bifunctional oligoribonuclease/PAP phosphatase NrnA n=1 Tax=Mycoplasma miroungirhinis TaxID=754516 RepID=A0A6M4JCZ1_9MOLU|nr:bifunctional oligoribonuclease/PAP phosphatase NrnA [Mycoplasma miroungirhinis]QJR43939.1 bifunctional oligoribonuclease/PAP phosphatase NrnA [Mycoplasma miroungirhinis]